jgi:copper(I)-binding protein
MPTVTRARFVPSLALVLNLLLAACAMPAGAPAAAPGAMETGEAAPPAPVPGQISANNVRARPAPLAGGNAAAFLLLLNGTDAPVTLTSVEASRAGGPLADAAELHETVEEDGVMKMLPRPEGFEVPAGGSVELAPGGKHVMLIGLAQPLEAGQAFSLTLHFDDGRTLDLSVPVVEMAGMPAMQGGESMHEGTPEAMPENTPTAQP